MPVDDNNQDKQIKTKKIFYDILLIVGILLIIAAGVYFFFFYRDYKNANEEYESIAKDYTSVVTEDETDEEYTYENVYTDEMIGQIMEEEERNFSIDTDYFGGNVAKTSLKKSKGIAWHDMLRVNLKSLQYSYKDVVGWIFFEKGETSYPVVQGEDNDYYLDHTLYGNESKAGAIFMDCNCPDSFDSSRIVIYGHNMRNYSMFGQLRFYKKDGYYEDNQYFQIFYKDKIRRYQVFSYFEIKDSDVDMVACDFETEAMMELNNKPFIMSGSEVSELDETESDRKKTDESVSGRKKTNDTESGEIGTYETNKERKSEDTATGEDSSGDKASGEKNKGEKASGKNASEDSEQTDAEQDIDEPDETEQDDADSLEEEIKMLANEKFIALCEKIAAKSNRIPGLDFNEDSRVISLITCSATGSRLMVSAIEVDEYTPE